jgi:hypothetical protein
MVDNAVTDFCQARERLRRAEAETREQRAEQNDAQRTLSGLLGESMARHDVKCIPLQDGQYVTLPPPRRRACSVKTLEDVLPLLENLAHALPEVAEEELPAAVARLVMERARDRGTLSTPRPRVQLRPPTKHLAMTHTLPVETRTLSQQFAGSVHECRETRRQLKPLRDAVRDCEKKAVTQMEPAAQSSSSSSTVQVHMQRPRDGKHQVLHISRVERKRSTGFGVRRVCSTVRDATAHLLRQGKGRECLNTDLAPEVSHRLTQEVPDATPIRHRLKVHTRPVQSPGNLPE